MSFMNSWCERLLLVSLTIITAIFLTDLKFNFLPINGLCLFSYILGVIIFTIWFTCVNIQKLLQQNTPFDYDYESYKSYKTFINIYNFIYKFVITDIKQKEEKASYNGNHTPEISSKHITDSVPFKQANNSQTLEVIKEKCIDERIEILVNDIEEKFISKWYHLISRDDTFSAESKILLEGIIRRVLQVSVQIDSSKLVCGALAILLKHLKEYRKALKRVQKIGGSIESVYRYSHIGNKNSSALEHFTHKLTANVLREFISWELWNSLPCRLLVSVLSKKLTTFFIFYVSQPGWLNYKFIYQAATLNDRNKLHLDKYLYISLSDVDLSDKLLKTEEKKIENGKVKQEKLLKSVSSTPQLSPKRETIEKKSTQIDTMVKTDSESVIEQALTKMITHQTAPILQRAEKSSENISGVFKPARSEPVKIHSAKSANKRWDETELSNVSLGQDLLALDTLDGSGIQGFSGRRLWGYNADINDELEDVQDIVKENEVKEITEVKEEVKLKSKNIKQNSPPSITSATAFVTNTIKPIVLKPSFLAGNVTATTLHNMRELQQSTVNNVVRPVSHVTEKAIHKIGDLQDEAVGVVEGIFDFGMAGIRKGLRLTGLQDNETKIPKPAPKLVKLGHVTSSTEDKLKLKEENIERESVWMNPIAKEESPNGYENLMLLEKSPNLDNEQIESIPETNLFLTDSPEYEETADLASTISKLRSLLQQKSSESSLNTPAVSPMLIDDKSCPTPTEPVLQDLNKVDGGMQRFARTVTGMFNTFKTALPGNAADTNKANAEQWIFIENELSENDLPSLLTSLLIERRDYCTVDAAYEAMDSLDLLTESVTSQMGKIQWEKNVFEDEIDDINLPVTKVLFDIICECLSDTNNALKQEPVIKALLILFGGKFETELTTHSEKTLRLLNKLIGPLPKNENDNVMAMKIGDLVQILENVFPCFIKEMFGHKDIKIGLQYFISSLQSQKINQDIMLQIFELVCSQLIYASSQMSPTPSA